jgi:hypothetical protein
MIPIPNGTKSNEFVKFCPIPDQVSCEKLSKSDCLVFSQKVIYLVLPSAIFFVGILKVIDEKSRSGSLIYLRVFRSTKAFLTLIPVQGPSPSGTPLSSGISRIFPRKITPDQSPLLR